MQVKSPVEIAEFAVDKEYAAVADLEERITRAIHDDGLAAVDVKSGSPILNPKPWQSNARGADVFTNTIVFVGDLQSKEWRGQAISDGILASFCKDPTWLAEHGDDGA